MNTKRLLMTALFAVAAFAMFKWGSRMPPTARHPVIVAYSAEGEHGLDTIQVYSESTGSSCVVKSRDIYNTQLYGYDADSDTWSLGVPFLSHYSPGYFVRIRKGKNSLIRLAQFPLDEDITCVRLAHGRLVVSYVQGSHLIVNNYSLDGALKFSRAIKLPDCNIAEGSLSVTVSRSGWLAADMRTSERIVLISLTLRGRCQTLSKEVPSPSLIPSGGVWHIRTGRARSIIQDTIGPVT